MKKNSNKIVVMSLVLLFVIIKIVIFPQSVQAEDESNEINNVQINNGILSWDAIQDADYYSLTIELEEPIYYSFSTYPRSGDRYINLDYPSINIYEICSENKLKTGNYKFKLSTCINRIHYLSNYSATIDYSYVSRYPQLATPSNIRWEGHKLVWNPVQNATGYEIHAYNVYNDEIAVFQYIRETEFDFLDTYVFLLENEYTLEVYAIDDSDDKRPTSEPGLVSNFEGWNTKKTITNFNISDTEFATWDEVEKSCTYVIDFCIDDTHLAEGHANSNIFNLYEFAKKQELTPNIPINIYCYGCDKYGVDTTEHTYVGQYVYQLNKFFTVNFKMSDGQFASKNVIPNSLVSVPNSLKKEGYKINGWYLTEDYQDYYTFKLNEPITSNKTVYGYWQLIFSDVVPDSWYINCIDFVYNKGLIKGYNDSEHEGMFGPNDKITRAQIVTILWRMEGSPANDGKSKFTDVASSAWYGQAVKWAAANKIVSGYTGTTKFGPKDNILRQDLAGVLRNYAKYKGKNVDVTANLTGFKDYKQISNYAKDSMEWAVGKKVITGNTKTKTLNPKGTSTRAEAASMIMKYCNNVGK